MEHGRRGPPGGPRLSPALIAAVSVGAVLCTLLGAALAHLATRALVRRAAAAEFEAQLAAREQDLRSDAAKRSRAVRDGYRIEQLLPLSTDWPYSPDDARFIGAPIDYLVFDGLDEGDLREVVFVEVKSGQSPLSAREKQVRDAIADGRVAFVEWRVDTEPDA